ncbi:MAG: hypothetical protein ABIQ75_02500 [Flavobacteriales bacterium]
MFRPVKITMTASAMLFALLMLVATGCSKEEVVAPNGAPLISRSLKPVQASNGQGGTSVTPGDTGNGVAPITDDGDDLGDKERSSKPKP